MHFCRVDQSVLQVDRSLLGCCGQFRRPLWRILLHITGESTSKADKFDNLRSMKILNTILTQKSPGIRTKRAEWRGTRELNEEEQNLQTKKGAISQPRRMRTPPDEQPATLVNFGGCFSTGVLFLTVVGLETTQQRNHPGGEEFWGGSIITIKLKMFEARLIRWSPNAHLYTSIFVWDCVQPKDPHAATHCNTLQDTATQYYDLQHSICAYMELVILGWSIIPI